MRIDAEVNFTEISHREVADVFALAPFGNGNPPPLLLAANAEGYQESTLPDIQLTLGQRATLDVVLRKFAATEEIAVVGRLDALGDRGRTGPSTVVKSRQILQLPLQGRNFTDLTSIDPRTGSIVAWYGGDDPAYYDLASLPQPPGSSFKPYVFLAAMENNPQVGINSLYDGSDNQKILDRVVHNADGEDCGPLCSVKQAMTESVYTVFYKMGADTGTGKVRDAALQAGIPPTMREAATGNQLPSLTNVDANGRPTFVEAGISLGQYPVRTVDMASAYATFANNGMRTTPHFVSEILDIVSRPTTVMPSASHGSETISILPPSILPCAMRAIGAMLVNV